MNAPAKITPMMAQYLEIKSEAGEETLLFYRMGDFYELFFNDAVTAAATLDIALTKRGKHQGHDIPMCGVPVHSAENYLARLIRAGHRVAVCEQTESPAEAKKRGSKSVVRREIVRIVTPGTLTEDTLLEARQSNFILAVSRLAAGPMALAWSDISEGSFFVCDVDEDQIGAQLAALGPREIILPETTLQMESFKETWDGASGALTPLPQTKFDPRSAERRLKDQYGVGALDAFGDFSRAELAAAGALLDYLELTQAGDRPELSPPRQTKTAGYVSIDPATRASLEIDRAQTGGRPGSLLSVIDKTVTGAGGRLLAERLSRPLTDVGEINARLLAVDYALKARELRQSVRHALSQTGDLARAVSRLALSRGGPRDMRVIVTGLHEAMGLGTQLPDGDGLPTLVAQERDRLQSISVGPVADLAQDLGQAISENPPLQARDGGAITPGWSDDLDRQRAMRDDSRKIIAGLQADYAKACDVPSLKIKHNNVLGYFIEVTARHGDALFSKTDTFIHRQTLASAVRFTTTELADLDAQVSGAGDRALALELDIFETLRARVHGLADALRDVARVLARLDVYMAGAQWAEDCGAVKPVVDDSLNFKIEDGKHPVVEAALSRSGDAGFTPNDCHLDASGKNAPRLNLITGPNMAGKSTYLRQNALMIILAQAGLFVPAKAAHIGIADRLFSRVGASDDLSRGRSTFMMEMIETAAILHQSTARSFVILDEIGRGTATFDGLSIAWATAEHLHEINGCRALFATHYHELTTLVASLDAAGNSSLKARDWNGELIFLHKVEPGAADRSYGIQVARLAGVPERAVKRAKDVLKRLESEHESSGEALGDLPLFTAEPAAPVYMPSDVDKAVEGLNPDTLSPRDALDVLYDLKKIADKSAKPS